jgi:hypothetical protein
VPVIGHVLGIVFLEPGFRGVCAGKHLDVLRVADLLAGVDVDKTVIGLSSACACPMGIFALGIEHPLDMTVERLHDAQSAPA